MEKFPKYYDNNKEYIDNNIKFYELCLTSYSFDFIFTYFHKLVLSNKEKYTNWGTLKYFYKFNSNEFKSIIEIIKEHKFTFIYFKILTTEAFINQLDFYSLTESEFAIMKIAVMTVLEEEKEKIGYIKKYLKEDNHIYLKIKLLYKLKPILVKYPSRIKLLENTLDKLNELIDNKNIKHTK